MRFGKMLLMSAASGMLLTINSSPSPLSGECDQCNDETVSVLRCLSARHHQMDSGGAESKYMALHNGSTWYCSDCDVDSDCPGEGGGGGPPIDHEEDPGGLAAVVRSGDLTALQKLASERARYLLLNKEDGLLALTNCKREIVAQYMVTPEQIAAVTD